jgi:hypothetical protein
MHLAAGGFYILLSEFAGSIMVEKKKRGFYTNVAMSLALMFMASSSRLRSTAPVMGSMLTMAFLLPKSKTAPSTACGGSKQNFASVCSKVFEYDFFEMSMGIFPGGSIHNPIVIAF